MVDYMCILPIEMIKYHFEEKLWYSENLNNELYFLLVLYQKQIIHTYISLICLCFVPMYGGYPITSQSFLCRARCDQILNMSEKGQIFLIAMQLNQLERQTERERETDKERQRRERERNREIERYYFPTSEKQAFNIYVQFHYTVEAGSGSQRMQYYRSDCGSLQQQHFQSITLFQLKPR